VCHFTHPFGIDGQAEEEVRELQKKMQQLENDLDQTQEKLMAANQRLEEKEKALQNVSPNYLCKKTNAGLSLFFLFFRCPPTNVVIQFWTL
jgi:uncharacterized membrane protein